MILSIALSKIWGAAGRPGPPSSAAPAVFETETTTHALCMTLLQLSWVVPVFMFSYEEIVCWIWLFVNIQKLCLFILSFMTKT